MTKELGKGLLASIVQNYFVERYAKYVAITRDKGESVEDCKLMIKSCCHLAVRVEALCSSCCKRLGEKRYPHYTLAKDGSTTLVCSNGLKDKKVELNSVAGSSAKNPVDLIMMHDDAD